jgi:hypothetical protein
MAMALLKTREQDRLQSEASPSFRDEQPDESAANYDVTEDRLLQLAYIPEDEDYTQPTQYAHRLARKLLFAAYHELDRRGELFPRASVTTTEAGNVVVHWRKPNLAVQIMVPCREEALGFVQDMADGNVTTQYDVSDEAIVAAVVRFNR